MTALLQDAKVDVYRKFVEAAVRAPSAENTQPWQFIVDGDVLTVCLDLSRTLASDIDHMLSLTAIGACIENGAIAATTAGLRSDVEIIADSIPTGRKPLALPVAQIRFYCDEHRDQLSDCIESRCTSRRMDRGRAVERSLLHKLEQSCDCFPDVMVHWVDPSRLRPISKLIGVGNRIRFEYEPFHRELYDNLRFTAEEAERTRDGLDVASLQLPPAVARIMLALRTWQRMKWANVIGFSRGVARQATQEMRHSGAVGFLTVAHPTTEQFIEGGRALERLWLTATCNGLCFHPTASLPVFLAHERSGGQQLTAWHRQLVSNMSERFYRLFPEVAGRAVQMAFRIGYGPQPPVRSLRRLMSTVVSFK